MHSEQLDKGQKRVVEEADIAEEALAASCIVKSAVQDTTGSKGQSRDGSKGQYGSHSTVCDLISSPPKYVTDLKAVILFFSKLLTKLLSYTNGFSVCYYLTT